MRLLGCRGRSTVSTLDVLAEDPSPLDRPERSLEVREVYAAIAELRDSFRLAIAAVDVVGLSRREALRSSGRRSTLHARSCLPGAVNRCMNSRAFSATPRHLLSMVSAWPRSGISTISVTPSLRCCLL
jgi:hypothetical protein